MLSLTPTPPICNWSNWFPLCHSKDPDTHSPSFLKVQGRSPPNTAHIWEHYHGTALSVLSEAWRTEQSHPVALPMYVKWEARGMPGFPSNPVKGMWPDFRRQSSSASSAAAHCFTLDLGMTSMWAAFQGWDAPSPHRSPSPQAQFSQATGHCESRWRLNDSIHVRQLAQNNKKWNAQQSSVA